MDSHYGKNHYGRIVVEESVERKEGLNMRTMRKTPTAAIKDVDLLILGELRRNSRQTLAEISRKTDVPISTIYDRIRFHEDKLIKKHTSIIDFGLLGYSIRTKLLITSLKKQDVREFLFSSPYVNSAYETNNGVDFIVDCFFCNMSDCMAFVEMLEKVGVEKTQVLYVVDELKTESFMEAR